MSATSAVRPTRAAFETTITTFLQVQGDKSPPDLWKAIGTADISDKNTQILAREALKNLKEQGIVVVRSDGKVGMA